MSNLKVGSYDNLTLRSNEHSFLGYQSPRDHYNSTMSSLVYETDSGIVESSSDTNLDDSLSRYKHKKPRTVFESKLLSSSEPQIFIEPTKSPSYVSERSWYQNEPQMYYTKSTVIGWNTPATVENRVTRTSYDEYYDRLLGSHDYEQPSYTNYRPIYDNLSGSRDYVQPSYTSYRPIYDLNTPSSTPRHSLSTNNRYYNIRKLSYDTILCKRNNNQFIAKRSEEIPEWIKRLVAMLPS
ncbi:unnamed protein product [Didymodactylos carnosus]|uniref:Uncharacterized protein n=1 Tax=Didymodactylos carnosus TaxID=1234261 RepID=A0A814MRH0_9BILA|nr:unnamed protein product [Didymodactylos carnosus]CAF1109937.1 unnamed protein product [Didymodactylos carnosus]CAF3849152.1 unnamed protein product [Didymodactylos carnosus]CAF3876574.1 unnamed protein product [Didymodactylos carnosus]